MQKRGLWHYSRPLLLSALLAVGIAPAVLAETSSSSHYQVTETQIGGGATAKTCSDQYCAKVSIGDTSGNTGSSTSTSQFATDQGSEPRLELIVDPGTSNLGVLKTEQTSTKTSVVRVDNYLVGGYQLVISGDPPKSGGHTLSAPSTPTASSPGTEQFAINVAANSTPSVGADPAQVPSNGTIFGQAATGYGTANRFKYVSGDTIAQSSAKSGRTDYTISFIVNISGLTPAGHYTGDYTVIAIPAY